MLGKSKLSRLTWLDLSENLLDREVPSWLFSLPSRDMLNLANNQFPGLLTVIEDAASNNTTLLKYIILIGNMIQRSTPNSIFELVSFIRLTLSSNNLSDIVELNMFYKLKNLIDLNLPRNSLSLLMKSSSTISSNVATCPRLLILECSSCNIIEFPNFLRTQEDLIVLDLSNNKIQGDIPKWTKDIDKDLLSYLDLFDNFLIGDLDLQWKNSQYIDLHSNKFEGLTPILLPFAHMLLASNNNFVGEIPSVICTLASLHILDLFYNSLSGEIPWCFKILTDQLSVLDLRSNKLHGTIPSSFGKCGSLRTMVLNGNQLGGQLPPSLLSCQRLQVLDMGNNNFKGTFPYWLGSLPELQVLILHSNSFHGNVGTSKRKHPFSKLRIFDISNNSFNSTLPSSFLQCFKDMMNSTEYGGKLQYLSESYYKDSVMLKVEGHDPKFVRILTGQQFATFENNSYLGNLGLCGNLLSKKCRVDEAPSQPPPRMVQDGSDSEYKCTFGWAIVGIGYACGMTIGLVAGYYVVIVRIPVWLLGLTC
ncbi:hypothetical protein Nepgr_030524 [Nepenthes gracilis]|uniref:Uncharacterized protein n=1 Tax=Nepenthes gracilis TaxID=150966 RepID=A0AAD3Y6M9_NEPGR|nr:hypothetical protein Nepgr_030524 [Nepenthes gracilis]